MSDVTTDGKEQNSDNLCLRLPPLDMPAMKACVCTHTTTNIVAQCRKTVGNPPFKQRKEHSQVAFN